MFREMEVVRVEETPTKKYKEGFLKTLLWFECHHFNIKDERSEHLFNIKDERSEHLFNIKDERSEHLFY